MRFWDKKKSGKILKIAIFSLFLLFFCTRICVYAAENQDFSREEEALEELDLKDVETAVEQLLEEHARDDPGNSDKRTGIFRRAVESRDSAGRVGCHGDPEGNLRTHSGVGASFRSVLSSVRSFSE